MALDYDGFLMDCKHWTDCGVMGGGCCALGAFGGKPSLGICRQCGGNPVQVTVSAPSHIAPESSEWPWWAKALKKRAQAGEKGIGDTLARKFGSTGEAFKKVMECIGIQCGCQQRQEWLNARYPY